MSVTGKVAVGRLRLLELLASISLATDLGTGQPTGHCLQTCTIATVLAREMGCDDDEVRTVQQATLLRFLGCTSDSAETAAMNGGDEFAFNSSMAPVVMGSTAEGIGRMLRTVGAGHPPLRRALLVLEALADPANGPSRLSVHCEVATMLADRMGLSQPVLDALAHGYERWDGKGFPDGLMGVASPLAVRIFVVARDVVLAHQLGQDPLVWLRRRQGRAYDPDVVDVCASIAREFLAELDGTDEWDAVLAVEPDPPAVVLRHDLDAFLLAVADFVDLKSPWTRGHSRRVAEFAEQGGRCSGLDEEECIALRQAGLLHDIGRVGVDNGIWDKAGPLTRGEWERVRLHTYLTGRILDRCGPLAGLVDLAACHHERLDGSGYHRRLAAEALPTAHRILSAADAFVALTADRPHRPAHEPDRAAAILQSEVGEHFDGAAVGCVLTAAGQRTTPPRRTWPAGLSDREVDVLRLIARGHTNKAVAEQLYISPKTVGRHVENLYRKIDVSSRAAAALFAMEHDLLA